MEPVFFITLISFWVYPVLAALLLNVTKKYLKLRRKILSILLLLSVIILLSITFGISTTSTVLNWLLATSLYFTGLTFLMLIFSMKNMALKIISGMVLFSVIAIGCLSSTLGVLGIGFIIDELTPSRIIILAPNVVYKQYDLGNAISKTDGIKVSMFKVSKWFPGFEYQFF